MKEPISYSDAQIEQIRNDQSFTTLESSGPQTYTFPTKDGGIASVELKPGEILVKDREGYFHVESEFVYEQKGCKITQRKEQDADGWINGIPPNNTNCIAYGPCVDEECRLIEHDFKNACVRWMNFNDGGYDVLPLSHWKFRPIKSQRDKVIESADKVIAEMADYPLQSYTMASMLYDAGMLSIPEGDK